MKHFNRKFLPFLMIAAGVLAISKSNAQNGRLQVIHNASGVLLDTVDVYLDGTKFDNVAFRSATPLLTVPATSYRFSINDRNSADSSDMTLFSQTVSISTAGNLIMVLGVDTPANYLANPDARATGIQIVHRKNVLLAASNNAVAATIVHGATDVAGADLIARPNSPILSNVKYGDTTGNIFPSASSTVIDVRPAGNSSVIKTYLAPFNAYNRKSVVVFASGFNDPAQNQNGENFGLFLVDTNGGNAIALSEVSRVQLINNAPDVILNSVDVWLNSTKIVTALDFRKATPMLTINSGTYDVTITKKNSPDTAGTNVISRFSATFISGKTYIGVTTGVVDTNQYATNPEGINRMFSFAGSDSYTEYSAGGTINLFVHHGTPDAPKLDINRISPSLLKLADDVSYNNNLSLMNISSSNGLINITNSDSSERFGTYRISLSGQNGKTGVLLTSGFKSATGNVTGALLLQPMIAFTDGTVQLLSKLTSDIQIVHNSADTNNQRVDVYVNGTLTLNNFAFRSATPFLKMDAFNPYNIAVAPEGSASAAEAFYTTTLTLDSSTNYYVIATGLSDASKYLPNPNSKDITFKIVTYKGANKTALNSKNVDLLFYHGSTDLQSVVIKGVGQVQFLAKDKAYGEFHGYGVHSAQENIRFEVRASVTDAFIDDMFGNLINYQGKAALVFASGFKKDTAAQNKYPLMLMIAWPDGNVDSIAPARLIGLEENSKQLIPDASVICYPNPAAEKLTVTFALNSSSALSVKLTDITGRIQLEKGITGEKGENKFDLNTSSLSPGLYFMNIGSGNQQVSKKILIAK